MKGFFNLFAHGLFKWARYAFAPFMLLLLASLILLGPEMWPVQINNTLDTLLEQGTEQAAIDKNIQQTFGLLDEIIILAYHDAELFTAPNLHLIKQVTDEIEAVEGVSNCFSIANTPYFRKYEKDGESVVESAPLLDKIPEDAAALARLKSEATDNNLFRLTAILQHLTLFCAPGSTRSPKKRLSARSALISTGMLKRFPENSILPECMCSWKPPAFRCNVMSRSFRSFR